MSNTIVMRYQGNLGYGADQIDNHSITLGEMLEAIQEAIAEYGDDAKVVTYQTNNRGANYGSLYGAMELFELADGDDE